MESVVRREDFTQRVIGQARALGPLSDQTNVGGDGLEGQHQIGLHESHYATESARDGLGILIAQVVEDPPDAAAPQVRIGPLKRSPTLALAELVECRTGSAHRGLTTSLGRGASGARPASVAGALGRECVLVEFESADAALSILDTKFFQLFGAALEVRGFR